MIPCLAALLTLLIRWVVTRLPCCLAALLPYGLRPRIYPPPPSLLDICSTSLDCIVCIFYSFVNISYTFVRRPICLYLSAVNFRTANIVRLYSHHGSRRGQSVAEFAKHTRVSRSQSPICHSLRKRYVFLSYLTQNMTFLGAPKLRGNRRCLSDGPPSLA